MGWNAASKSESRGGLRGNEGLHHFHQPASGGELNPHGCSNYECTLFPSPNMVGRIHNSSEQNLSCHAAAATALSKGACSPHPLKNPRPLAAWLPGFFRGIFTSEAHIISFGKHGGDAPVEEREKRRKRGPRVNSKPLGSSVSGSG